MAKILPGARVILPEISTFGLSDFPGGGHAEGDGNIGATVQNAINIVGGLGQISAGLLATSTAYGSFVGIPLMVTGVVSIIDGLTGIASPTGNGVNISQVAIKKGLSALDVSNSVSMSKKYNALINLSLDLVGLNLPQLSRKSFMLFRHISSDFTAAKYQMTRAGIGFQAASTFSTTIGALDD